MRLLTHSEGQICSDGDLGTEVNVAVGVADSKHGVARSQSLSSHPAAMVLARSQPLWTRMKRVGGSQKVREDAI